MRMINGCLCWVTFTYNCFPGHICIDRPYLRCSQRSQVDRSTLDFRICNGWYSPNVITINSKRPFKIATHKTPISMGDIVFVSISVEGYQQRPQRSCWTTKLFIFLFSKKEFNRTRVKGKYWCMPSKGNATGLKLKPVKLILDYGMETGVVLL